MVDTQGQDWSQQYWKYRQIYKNKKPQKTLALSKARGTASIFYLAITPSPQDMWSLFVANGWMMQWSRLKPVPECNAEHRRHAVGKYPSSGSQVPANSDVQSYPRTAARGLWRTWTMWLKKDAKTDTNPKQGCWLSQEPRKSTPRLSDILVLSTEGMESLV